MKFIGSELIGSEFIGNEIIGKRTESKGSLNAIQLMQVSFSLHGIGGY